MGREMVQESASIAGVIRKNSWFIIALVAATLIAILGLVYSAHQRGQILSEGAEPTETVQPLPTGTATEPLDCEPDDEGQVASGCLPTTGQFVGGQASISGAAKVGSTLTAGARGFSPMPSGYDFQWLRNGGPIGGATGKKYTLQNADSGATVSVRVTARKADLDPKEVTSSGVNVAAGAMKVGTVSISGNGAVGKTIQAKISGFNPTPQSFSYQWLRDGRPIGGATGTSYTLTAADAGHRVAFQATAKIAGFADSTATSREINVK